MTWEGRTVTRAPSVPGRPRSSGFTLLELIVVLAIIAILVGLLMVAVQQTRVTAARLECANNLKQLALGLHNHHDAHGHFPYAVKADEPGVYNWYHAVLPYVEQDAAYRSFYTLHSPADAGPWGADPRLQSARTSMSKVFLCPADTGLVLDEAANPYRNRARGSYRGCVGDGDAYGDPLGGGGSGAGLFQVMPGQRWGAGPAPCTTRLTQATDGTSETVLLSEGLIGRAGVPGDIQSGSMAGALFSTRDPPNGPAPDRVMGPCPQQAGDGNYRAPCLTLGPGVARPGVAAGATAAARSRHPRGVNVAFADGSVRFVNDSISGKVWQGLGTRGGGEVAGEPTSSPRTVTRILFIGNSYTGTNDLPGLVRSMWQGGPVDIQSHIVGGSTLAQHWNEGQALALIRSGKWDFVVLQEQSMLPIVGRMLMWYYARLFDAEIRKAGGRTVFYMTWARSWWPESQAALTNAYQGIARELGADVAPVGLAWEDTLRLRPDITLFVEDGSHPSPRGSYLAACVMLAVLGGGPSDNLPPPPGISGDDARFLRQIAGAVARGWK